MRPYRLKGMIRRKGSEEKIDGGLKIEVVVTDESGFQFPQHVMLVAIQDHARAALEKFRAGSTVMVDFVIHGIEQTKSNGEVSYRNFFELIDVIEYKNVDSCKNLECDRRDGNSNVF